MAIATLAPEYVVTNAFRDWRYARGWLDELKTWSKSQKRRFYRHSRREKTPLYWPTIPKPWGMTHAFFIEMGGLSVELPNGVRFRLLKDQSRDPTDNDMVHEFRSLMLDGMRLPSISEEEILDKSKASWAVKVISYFQISWFVAQTVGRSVQNLLVSPLEWFTLAIVICTLVSYLLWWKKPLDVDTPIIIKYDENVSSMVEKFNLQDDQDIEELISSRQGNLQLYSMFHLDRVCFMVAMSLAFAACHLLAWNWAFPSLAEKWMWRLASIGCALFPTIFGLLQFLHAHMDDIKEKIAERLDYFIGPFYVLCRLYLLVEIFACLRSMPPGVYTNVRWTEYLPHF
ncbi:hypothetical protein BU16DRAFT_602968 [Lophium mytilinum]|uniref:Uncharacterized protein n=1 Tax=Lophium mytilinum TaxID=390894 RepID=A0A6A6R8R5_9PEZI|nr:hypothetical protein BU16DRAFT_602968 [Lophium mytilinum]